MYNVYKKDIKTTQTITIKGFINPTNVAFHEAILLLTPINKKPSEIKSKKNQIKGENTQCSQSNGSYLKSKATNFGFFTNWQEITSTLQQSPRNQTKGIQVIDLEDKDDQ